MPEPLSQRRSRRRRVPWWRPADSALRQRGGTCLSQRGGTWLSQRGDTWLSQRGSTWLSQRGSARLSQRGGAAAARSTAVRDEYVRHFLAGELVVGAEAEAALGKALLPLARPPSFPP